MLHGNCLRWSALTGQPQNPHDATTVRGGGHIFVAEKQFIVLLALDEASCCRDLRLEPEAMTKPEESTWVSHQASTFHPLGWIKSKLREYLEAVESLCLVLADTFL